MITKRKLSFCNPWTPKTWSDQSHQRISISNLHVFRLGNFGARSQLRQSYAIIPFISQIVVRPKNIWPSCVKMTKRMATYICCAFIKPCLNLKKRHMDWHFKFLMPKIREVTLLASQFMAFRALSSKDSPAGLHGSFRADLGQLKHESSHLS